MSVRIRTKISADSLPLVAQCVDDTTILQLGEHAEPERGAFTPVTGPEPEDVAGALDGHG